MISIAELALDEDRDITAEEEDRTALAGLLLFTTEPTDRALAGWCAIPWRVTR